MASGLRRPDEALSAKMSERGSVCPTEAWYVALCKFSSSNVPPVLSETTRYFFDPHGLMLLLTALPCCRPFLVRAMARFTARCILARNLRTQSWHRSSAISHVVYPRQLPTSNAGRQCEGVRSLCCQHSAFVFQAPLPPLHIHRMSPTSVRPISVLKRSTSSPPPLRTGLSFSIQLNSHPLIHPVGAGHTYHFLFLVPADLSSTDLSLPISSLQSARNCAILYISTLLPFLRYHCGTV